MHRRHQADHETADQDQRGGEEKDPRIESDLVRPRNRRRVDPGQGAHGEGCETDAEDPSKEGHDKALGDETEDHASSRLTQSRPDGDLAAAGQGPPELQVDHVGAGGQQNEADRDEQNDERRTDVAGQLLVERGEAHPPSTIAPVGIREILLHTVGDGAHIGLRHAQIDAGLQPPETGQIVVAPVFRRIQAQRCPKVDVLRISEAGGHDTDDGVKVAVDGQIATDHLRIRSVATVPERVTEHSDTRRIQPIFAVGKHATVPGLNPQNGKQRGRHERELDPLRLAHSGEVSLRGDDCGESLERGVLITVVEKLGHRALKTEKTHLGEVIPYRHHAICAGIRQGSQEHGVDDTEDRHGGADSERHRGDRRRDRNRRAAEKRLQVKTHILVEISEHEHLLVLDDPENSSMTVTRAPQNASR